MRARINWQRNTFGETGFNIYRDTAPLDPGNLPAPLGTAPARATEYVDETVVDQTTYYYLVAAVYQGVEYKSPVLQAVINGPDVIAVENVAVVIAVADPAHASATATRDLLIAEGFTPGNVVVHDQDQPIPACDVILVPRGSASLADSAQVRQAYQNGTSVVSGVADGMQDAQTANLGFSYHANLTGSIWPSSGRTSAVITDNTHFITEGFPTGSLAVNSASSYQAVVQAAGDHVGLSLATGDPSIQYPDGDILVAFPAGVTDLQGGTTPARAVFCGFLYGGQGAYAPAAGTLVTRSIQWCLMG